MGGGNALTESVKVPKGRRQREGRIFADQSGGKARDVSDEVGGEGIKEGCEGGGTKRSVPVGHESSVRQFLEREQNRRIVFRLGKGRDLQKPQVV